MLCNSSPTWTLCLNYAKIVTCVRLDRRNYPVEDRAYAVALTPNIHGHTWETKIMSQEYRVTTSTNDSPDETMQAGQGIVASTSKPIYLYLTGRQSNKGKYVEYKIGITNNPTRRAKEIFKGYDPHPINWYYPCDASGEYSARVIEKSLHTLYKYAGLHITGEWFRLAECDIELFKSWFGAGRGAAPVPALVNMLFEAARICESHSKHIDKYWYDGTMVMLLNGLPKDTRQYGYALASIYGYRRLTEMYTRRFSPRNIELFNAIWQTAINMATAEEYDAWKHTRLYQYFDDMGEMLFSGTIEI